MLRREVEILKTVKHPNIVEIVAVYDEPNYLHIVSELCTGGELFERIIKKSASAEKHFSEADAARMLAEILGAVAYCHGLDPPVVHRDLKPENFLFKTPGEAAPIKIIDFGLSRAPQGGGAAESTTMHTRVGTPYYIAPEVLKRDYTLKHEPVWTFNFKMLTFDVTTSRPRDAVRRGQLERLAAVAREPRQVCDRLSPTQVRRVVHRRHRLHPSLRLSAVERSVENGPEVAPVRIRDRPWASVALAYLWV